MKMILPNEAGKQLNVELQRDYTTDACNHFIYEIRQKRNRLLAESDWTQLPDAPLSDKQKEVWRAYRKALRDMPQQEGFPTIAFPQKPSVT